MRKLIQSLLVAPTALAPFGWLLLVLGSSGSSIDMVREVFPERTAITILAPVVGFIGLSAISLVALWTSIVVDASILTDRLRRTVMIGIGAGLLLDGWLLVQVARDASTIFDRGLAFGLAWILIGPPIVAVWNLVRLFRGLGKGPNQTPEPTPLLVTDRADARSAPSKGVAHL